MSATPASTLLAAARRDGFAVAAFNAVNLETAQAIVMAADAEESPVIVQISENAARYAGLASLAAIGRTLREESRSEVILHFDHAESLDSARRAIDLGFDSVMLEGADLPDEENIARIRELASYAQAAGVAVEAELEVVTKGERRAERGMEPERLALLASESGCDFVALDIGSEHRRERGEMRLDLDRLRAVALCVPHPLVLHGGSSVALDELQTAIAHGIAKVNVATELMRTFTGAVRTDLEDPTCYDPRRYLGSGRTAMCENAREIIRLLRPGSSR